MRAREIRTGDTIDGHVVVFTGTPGHGDMVTIVTRQDVGEVVVEVHGADDVEDVVVADSGLLRLRLEMARARYVAGGRDVDLVESRELARRYAETFI